MFTPIFLLSYHRTLPLFVWHRQNWNIIYPNLSLEEESEKDILRNQTCYVAGFTDPGVEAHAELYDLFVDGKPARTDIRRVVRSSCVWLNLQFRMCG